jgi:23S rRNA (adenine-N6)-dimethyltransferase
MSSGNRKYTIQYSQNRLRSRILIGKLLDKSSITKGDLVYDVGAGCGIISEELAKRQARVIAIEQDNKLFNRLKQKLGDNPLVTIRHGDFLVEPLPSQARYKVFANIPFVVTADIVRKLLFSQNPPDDCYLVMQREAAQKFAGTPTETLFSLLMKPWFEFRILHSFRRSDFSPVPTVEILLLQVERKKLALVEAEYTHLYRDFVAYGFGQGKPALKNALKEIFTYSQFIRLSKDLGFRPESGPTDLVFRQWLGLFDFFLKRVDRERRELISASGEHLRRQQLHLKKVHRTRKEGISRS